MSEDERMVEPLCQEWGYKQDRESGHVICGWSRFSM